MVAGRDVEVEKRESSGRGEIKMIFEEFLTLSELEEVSILFIGIAITFGRTSGTGELED